MKCHRCQGLMVPEWCAELLVETYVMRCVNCGAITDPTIEQNQSGVAQRKRPVLATS